MNPKGIALFLGLNYLLVGVLTLVFVSKGFIAFQTPNVFQYLAEAAMMGIPALCAVVALYCCPDNAGGLPKIWPIPWKPALRVTLLVPLAFAAIYGIATALGLTYPQWNLASLMNRVSGQLGAPLPPEAAAAAPAVALVFYPLIGIIVGATLFAFIALGSEIGWRAYLLPRLMPLGRVPAILLTGGCWGLWFLPLLYAWHRETGQMENLSGNALRAVALAIALGALLAQITLRTRHLGVTALALGAFAGQAFGIWGHLFQQGTRPWTGTAGWIAIAVWGLLAFAPALYAPPSTKNGEQPSD